MTKWNLQPRTLQGTRVRLEPPSGSHIPELCETLLNEPNGWYATRWNMRTPDSIAQIIERKLMASQARTSIPFVVRDLISGKAVGLTSLHNIIESKRQLEIGQTQYGKDFRRSHVNTETKFLLLREAFETLGAIRVYFKVDSSNLISQKAVLRLGAIYEGCLRDDCLLPSGERGDFLVYSILEREWPGVKTSFDQKLLRDYSSPQEIDNGHASGCTG